MGFFSYHLEAQFCPICDKGGESSSECQFYRKDSRLAYEGKLPTDYAALEELENTSIIYCDYKVDSIDKNSVTLTRNSCTDYDATLTFLGPRKVVRIIGKEESIPLLGSVSEKGFVREVQDSRIIIDLDGSICRTCKTTAFWSWFSNYTWRDKLNAHRVLEPMHRFHKLAADDTFAQAQSPQSTFNRQITAPLDVADSIYNANTTTFLGSKNISFTPYPMTEEHSSDQGFLKGVGNITNNQTYISTHLSDEII
jgi:hypothetical protein